MGLRSILFAAGYDRFMAGTERAGLREQRSHLLAGASGRVLEIGAGTGVNLELYPAAVEQLVLTEPDEPMAKRLRTRAADTRRSAEVRIAPAEQLPFADASFDTVVATLVLCTVADVERSLTEIHRVLIPGGRFLFLEHVRSEDPRIARRQDRWHAAWRFIGNGCNTNRATAVSIGDAGFAIEELTPGRLPKAPSFVRPLVSGTARRI